MSRIDQDCELTINAGVLHWRGSHARISQVDNLPAATLIFLP